MHFARNTETTLEITMAVVINEQWLEGPTSLNSRMRNVVFENSVSLRQHAKVNSKNRSYRTLENIVPAPFAASVAAPALAACV